MVKVTVSHNQLPTSHAEEPPLSPLLHEELWIDGVHTPMLPAQEVLRLSRHYGTLRE